jgi:seryl-tRNA synthetase
MLDINFVRENPEVVKASEKKRENDSKNVDLVLDSDQKWKKELKVMEKLKHTRNVVSQEINQAKKNKKESEAKKKIKEMKSVVEDLKKSEDKVNKLLKKRNDALKLIGNVLHESVPKGKDDSENVELRKWGKIPKFDFPIKDHIELAEELDLIIVIFLL